MLNYCFWIYQLGSKISAFAKDAFLRVSVIRLAPQVVYNNMVLGRTKCPVLFLIKVGCVRRVVPAIDQIPTIGQGNPACVLTAPYPAGADK